MGRSSINASDARKLEEDKVCHPIQSYLRDNVVAEVLPKE